jgi:hypothetical protein
MTVMSEFLRGAREGARMAVDPVATMSAFQERQRRQPDSVTRAWEQTGADLREAMSQMETSMPRPVLTVKH